MKDYQDYQDMPLRELYKLADDEFLYAIWGDAGKSVADAASHVTRFDGNREDFLRHCTACGGNWGGMLLTGIKELFPSVWDAIPDDMGINAWAGICTTLRLCGVIM